MFLKDKINEKYDNPKIYVVSDTHFSHQNIIKYCDRPFKDEHHMNEVLIHKWNKVIKEDDVVIHLGDVGFGSINKIMDDLRRLNGIKYLVPGNHDYGKHLIKYETNEIFEVLRGGAVFFDESTILTHKPYKKHMMEKAVTKNPNTINVHGHIHNKTLQSFQKDFADLGVEDRYEDYDFGRYLNVSVEMINYKPILIEDMIHIHDLFEGAK